MSWYLPESSPPPTDDRMFKILCEIGDLFEANKLTRADFDRLRAEILSIGQTDRYLISKAARAGVIDPREFPP